MTGYVGKKRKSYSRSSMFVRMLVRAAVLRRGRAASALVALAVAAAVTTAMLTLHLDVQSKLRSEFRNYGANLVVVAKDGASLPSNALAQVDSVLGPHGVAAPFAMVVARTPSGQPLVVVGTDFARVQKLDHWWSVSHWPVQRSEALVGVRARSSVTELGKPFDLKFQDHNITLSPAGTVQTGAAEDSRIYISLPEFMAWTGVQPNSIEIYASGTPDAINATMRQLSQTLPTADVRPVRQIVEGEARVLRKTNGTMVAATVLIILTAALSVLSTLMGWVFDRRRDFAIMKALGASERLLDSFFAAEAGILGATGAILGFIAGLGVAIWIGRVNFQASVTPRFSVLPVVVAGSMVVTLLSAAFPISLLRRVQPAAILRGE